MSTGTPPPVRSDRPVPSRTEPLAAPGKLLVILKRLQKCAVQGAEIVGGAMLMTLLLVVMVGVFDRYVFHVGLSWTEELSRFLLIWLSFLSGALAVVRQGHYVLDFVYRAILGELGQRIVGRVAANIISLAVVATLFVFAFDLAERVSWQGAPALQISMTWIYAALPVSLGLMALFYAVETIEALLDPSREGDS